MDELVQALLSTGYAFAHFGWSKAPSGDYGVYAEEGANDLVANGQHVERATRLTVDYFTRTVESRQVIENALEQVHAAWYLNSIQFESDTGYVHLEWVVEVLD